MTSIRCTAPGKVLVVGGYMVLDRPNKGLVISVNSRFYCDIQPIVVPTRFWSFISSPTSTKSGTGNNLSDSGSVQASSVTSAATAAQRRVTIEVHSPQFGRQEVFEYNESQLTPM
jgi:hypothetical protein